MTVHVQQGSRGRVLAAVLCFLLAAGAGVGQEMQSVQNVRLPLDRYPDGSIHRQLHAGSATLSETGPIKAKDVRVEVFTPEGALEMVVEAVECQYDRSKGRVVSSEDVRAEGRGMVLTGKGFDWDIEGQELRVLENVRLEFDRKVTDGKVR